MIHSPAETAGVWPTTVTRSRLPRVWTFRTAKPFSALWKVTRSTEPARVSKAGRLISLCGSEHLVHGACWEEFPASSTLSLDGTADEVVLLRSHHPAQAYRYRPRGRLSASSKEAAGGQA